MNHADACSGILLQTIVATAIPKITNDFHSLGDVSWYGSVFFVTCAGFLAACKAPSTAAM